MRDEDFTSEHRRLVDVLKHPTRRKLKREAAIQERELKEKTSMKPFGKRVPESKERHKGEASETMADERREVKKGIHKKLPKKGAPMSPAAAKIGAQMLGKY